MEQSESRRQLHKLVQPLLPHEDSCASRLRLSLQMMDAGIEMMRLTLARRFPQDDPEQIGERLRLWLEEQPRSAEFRDGMHRLSRRP